MPTAAYKSIHHLKEVLTTSSQFLLDIEADCLNDIATQICENLVANQIIDSEFAPVLKATLLARHHHHHNRKHNHGKNGEQTSCHHQHEISLPPIVTRSHHTNAVDPLAEDLKYGFLIITFSLANCVI